MILVDTSVVIAQLRSSDPRLLALFKTHDAAICGLTRAEVLYGVRTQADHSRFIAVLNAVAHVSIPDGLWDEAGLNLATMRASGFPMPLADVVIATLAIHLDVEPWARDQHFSLIQAVIPGLRLFSEPP
jgi:predicted nucleic acid-binding protein